MLTLKLKDVSGSLPTSTYDLYVDVKKVGYIQIRHKSSHSDEVPAECASHIYYEIDEKERGKGYGTEILRLGKEKAKETGLTEIIVTCLGTNIPSKKVIEVNGGILAGQCTTTMNETMLKYKISL